VGQFNFDRLPADIANQSTIIRDIRKCLLAYLGLRNYRVFIDAMSLPSGYAETI